jgi:hypothetical protein
MPAAKTGKSKQKRAATEDRLRAFVTIEREWRSL